MLDSPPVQVYPSWVYCVVWIFFSGATILYNKWLLTHGFPYPLTLTAMHQLTAAVLTFGVYRLVPGAIVVPSMTVRTYMVRIAPIGLLLAASLGLGNYAFLTLSVPFIQMLKAFSPVLVYILSASAGLRKYEPKALATLTFVTGGLVVASFHEGNFHLAGFLFQAVGVVVDSTRLVLIEQTLRGMKLDVLASLLLYSPLCFAGNFVLALALEIRSDTFAAAVEVGPGWLVLNCLVAFLLNISIVYLIKRTSSLVLTLSGIAKDLALLVTSVLVFQALVAPMEVAGYIVAIGGIFAFKIVGMNDEQYASVYRMRFYLGGLALVAIPSLFLILFWNA